MAAKSASKISFEDFTTTTMSAIVRAMDANKGSSNPLLRNPHILIGIVWSPEGGAEFQSFAKKAQ
jgi:hypothetical protein